MRVVGVVVFLRHPFCYSKTHAEPGSAHHKLPALAARVGLYLRGNRRNVNLYMKASYHQDDDHSLRLCSTFGSVKPLDILRRPMDKMMFSLPYPSGFCAFT